MTDALFFEYQEILERELGREPTYEEVQDYLNYIFKEKDYERINSRNFL